MENTTSTQETNVTKDAKKKTPIIEILQRMQKDMDLVHMYYRGEIDLTELHARGVKFLKDPKH